ncbi:MAG: hypothetical protein UDN39_04775 [Christensenellales bacterium]|nr:hypothetical protein [Christensenellales bacterium]
MSRGWCNKETVIEQKAILKKMRARNARPYNQRCEKTTARDVAVPVGARIARPLSESVQNFGSAYLLKERQLAKTRICSYFEGGKNKHGSESDCAGCG